MSSAKKNTPPAPPALQKISPMYRWELMALLFLAYFFHQADRAIYGVVAASLKQEFAMSDALLGMTRTIMFTLMALIVPFAGFVGDRLNKRRLLIGCLFCWSIATLCTGSATSVLMLTLFNSVALVVAEAFYGPASTSLIASYHKETRSLALSIHQTAVYLSVIFCGGIAGYISQHYDWRTAFWLFGGVSLCIGMLLIWRLKDPAKVEFSDGSKIETIKPSEKTNAADSILGFLKTFFTTPSAMLLTVGFTAIVFVNNAYLNVISLFLQRKFDLDPTAAGFNGMFWHHIAALICIFLGATLSDRMSKKNPTFRPKLQFIAMLVGAPVVCLIGFAPSLATVYALFFLMGVCRGFYECNTHASVFETIPVKYRSTTVGVMILFAFLIGAWSAQIVGSLYDTYGMLGYKYSFMLLGATWVVGACCVGFAAFKTFGRDRDRRIAMEEGMTQSDPAVDRYAAKRLRRAKR